MTCLHEPFMYDYYLSQRNRDMPYFEPSPEHAQNYEAVRQLILQQAELGPVFFKDMSYYVLSKLDSDKHFSQQIAHCFLIRNPRASIASYYNLDNEVTLEEIGLEAQWKHYSQLTTLGIKPVVIEAEAIGRNPKKCVGKWWESIGLDFVDSAFIWNQAYPSDWDAVKTWHNSVIATTSIKTRTNDDELSEHIRFEKALKAAPQLQGYLDHHMPFYKLLKTKARQQNTF